MPFVESATELTTAATDAVLALECVLLMRWLHRQAGAPPWRARLWGGVFALMAAAALLGAVAHGFAMPEALRDLLWLPLYLALGILVALVVVGAVADWRGWTPGRRLLPWAVAAGVALVAVTQLLGGAFLIFIVYEGAALLAALAIYVLLAVRGRLPGAGVVALGLVLNLAAAAIQASDLSLHLVVPFDHNGVFHLVQMFATAVLALGLGAGMRRA